MQLATGGGGGDSRQRRGANLERGEGNPGGGGAIPGGGGEIPGGGAWDCRWRRMGARSTFLPTERELAGG